MHRPLQVLWTSWGAVVSRTQTRAHTVLTYDVCPLSTENDVLTRNLVTVINYLDVKSIRPHLRQARVISEQDYLELLKIRDDSRREQAEALIQIVKRKGIEGFHKFLHVLRYTLAENPGHKDIISALETDAVYQQNNLWLPTTSF